MAFLFEKLLQSNASHVRMLLKDYVLCSIFFSLTNTGHCLCTPLFLQNVSQLKCQAEKGRLNMRAEESWLYHLEK